MEYYLSRVGIKVPREEDVVKLLVNLKSVWSNLELINSMLLHPPEGYEYDEDALLNLPAVPMSLPVSVSPPVFIMDKNTLPLLTYGEFQQRRRRTSDTEEEEEVEVCSICLSNMERMEEMRELPNCSHAFHTHCLDKWMDRHHITCPTCRSNLHPLS